MSASIKLRWKKHISELRFVHEELEMSKEISKSAGPDFQDFYEAYCKENEIDLDELNNSHSARLSKLYDKQNPEDGNCERPENPGDNHALIIHDNTNEESVYSEEHGPEAQNVCEYQMTKDEKEIHDSFHKVFKKLAMMLHPDKLEEDLTPEQKKERLDMFKQSKEALEKRKYFALLEIAEKFKVATPRNYKQQIRWMKKETETLRQQINKEKSTYNYVFAECETDEERRRLIRSFLSQVFKI